ncbi:MAG TPA: hypothetical protein VF514_06300 [Bacteroidota bacterium]
MLNPHLFRGIGLSAILGASFGTAAVTTLYDDVTSLRHMDTGTHMLAGMMNNDVPWTGLGIHPYVQL